MKKRVGILVGLLICSIFGFSACGDPYKKMTFSLLSEGRDLTSTIELTLAKNNNQDEDDIKESFEIDATVGGVGKKISKQVEVWQNDNVVSIETSSKNANTTTIKVTANREGETVLTINPVDNPDGKFTRYVKVKVCVALNGLSFKPNAFSPIALGESLDLSNIDTRSVINFTPDNTSYTDVKYEVVDENNTGYAVVDSNNILHTYTDKTYPTNSENIKCVRLQVTSVVKALGTEDYATDIIDIPVIDVGHTTSVVMGYGDDEIKLSPNNSGKYEVKLAYQNTVGDRLDAKYISRQLQFAFLDKEGNPATSKYRISLVGEYSLTSGKSVRIERSNADILTPNSYDFLVESQALTSQNGMDVTFKVEYFGDSSDNPTNDETKYEGVFTRYITVTFYVYRIPTQLTVKVNGNVFDYNDDTVVVYDEYYTQSGVNENGTAITIDEADTTMPNLKYSIKYNKSMYSEGYGAKGLQVLANNKIAKIDADLESISKGATFYLKHNYDTLEQGATPNLKISLQYSFAPSNATEDQLELYGYSSIDITINLKFMQGLKSFVLPEETFGLDVTDDSWIDFYEFPEGYVAEETIYKVTGLNVGNGADKDLIELKYVGYKIQIRPNSNLSTPKTGNVELYLISNNGLRSTRADIIVYSPNIYEDAQPLLIDVDESSDTLLYKGMMTGDNTYVSDDSTGVCQEHTYYTVTSLILSSNSSIALDVYNLKLDGANLVRVMPNVDVSYVVDAQNRLSWSVAEVDGVLKGTLYTYGASKDKVTITFTLSGYKKEAGNRLTPVTISTSVDVWVFDTIDKVDFQKKFVQLYLYDSIGSSEQDAKGHKFTYAWNISPDPDNTESVFGNFSHNVQLINGNALSHSIKLSAFNIDKLQAVFGYDLSGSKLAEDVEVKVDGVNRIRFDENVGAYYFDIYVSDLIRQDGDNDGYIAQITDTEFEVNGKNYTLIQLFEALIGESSVYAREKQAIARIFDGSENEGGYWDFILVGEAGQFERKQSVSTTIRVYNPVRVKSISTSTDSDGLYFEIDDGVVSGAQTLTYSISPTTAHNTNTSFTLYEAELDGNKKVVSTGELANLCIKATQPFTISTHDGEKFVTIGDTEYKYDSSKMYLQIKVDDEWKDSSLAYTIKDKNTLLVEVLTYTGEGENAPVTISVVDNVITVSVSSVGGYYILQIGAEDSRKDEGKCRLYCDVPISIGDGSYENPFEIRTVAALEKMWTRNESDKGDYCYRLVKNLNVSGINFQNHILSANNIFKGDFDGNNKYISGLTMSSTISKDVTGGLFAKYDPAETNYKIHDLTLQDIRFDINIATASEYALTVGGIVGKSSGTLQNIFVSGNINITYSASSEDGGSTISVGGVVGEMSGGVLSAGASSQTPTANVAIAFKGLSAGANGSHIIGEVVGSVSDEASISNITASGQISTMNGDNATLATLGGIVGKSSATLTVKDVRVTPTLIGNSLLGGVVGKNSGDLTLNHVVVEFLHNDNIKNHIVGYDKLGGFIGQTAGATSIINSYIRSFANDIVSNKAYNNNEYCGNIILLSGNADSTIGGMIGSAQADVTITSSYVMGDIKSYSDTTYVGGFIGSRGDDKQITVTNAYFDGNILSKNTIPQVLIGNLLYTTTNGSLDNISIEINDINKSNITSDYSAGQFIVVSATQTEDVSYMEYKATDTNILLSSFYARVNGNYHSWVKSGALALRTPQGTIETTLELTLAVYGTVDNNVYFAFNGKKTVVNYTDGSVKSYSLYPADKEQNTNISISEEVAKAVGAILNCGYVADLDVEDTYYLKAERIVFQKTSIESLTSSDVLKTALTALGETATDDDARVKALISKCQNNETSGDSVDKIDIANIPMQTIFAQKLTVKDINDLIEIEGETYRLKDGTITIESGNYNFTLYVNNNKLYIDSGYNYEFSGYVLSEDGSSDYTIPLTLSGSKLLDSSGNIKCYVNGDKFYSDADFENEATSVSIGKCSYSSSDEQVCDLYYGEKLMFTDVEYNADDKTIVLAGKTYTVKSDGTVLVIVGLAQLSTIYEFNYTNGEKGETKDDYLWDTEGHKIAKIDDSKFVLASDNAAWVVTDSINGGYPVLIRVLDENEKVDKIDVLYDAVSSMNVKVTPFSYNNSSNITPRKQSYVRIDDSNVILFYNSAAGYYMQNTYLFAKDKEEKTLLDSKFVGGQAPIIVEFSDILLNEPFELNALKDYIIKSSDTNIVSITQTKIDDAYYSCAQVLGTGKVTLTFVNKYDDKNRFEITVYIVAGVTGTNDIEEMHTYVNRANTYSYGFDNTIVTDSNSYPMEEHVGGYELSVTKIESGAQFTYNGITVNAPTDSLGTTFDMSTPITIFGLKAGTATVEFKPYIIYGNGEKYYLDYLNKTVEIKVTDIARDITTDIASNTMKPESNVSFVMEATSSAAGEDIKVTITDKNGVALANKVSLSEIVQTYGMINVYASNVGSQPIAGTNLYTITWNIYIEFNSEEYYKYFDQNEYANPLVEALKYNFEFVPASWIDGDKIVNEYSDSTAKYSITIEPNSVSDLYSTFFNTVHPSDEELDKYIIDTDAEVLPKMQPGNTGLLRLTFLKKFNNINYVSITSNNSGVSFRQATFEFNSNIATYEQVGYLNTKIDGGIKLWNIVYGTKYSNYAYGSEYYVLVDFASSLSEGSTVDLAVVAYGEDGSVLLEKTINLTVDVMPHVYVQNMQNESSGQSPIGEYYPIKITTLNVENTLTWEVKYSKAYKFYDSESEYKEETTNLNANYFPYICYEEGGKYVRLSKTFDVSMTTEHQLYIYLPADTYLGDFEVMVNGYRVVNTRNQYTTGKFALGIVLYEVQDLQLNGAISNVFTLPMGDYTTLSISLTLNDHAQDIVNNIEDNENVKKVLSGSYEEIKEAVDKTSFTDLEKYMYLTVQQLIHYNIGRTYGADNQKGRNGWIWYDQENNSYNGLKTGRYNNGSFSFGQLDSGLYTITGLKISTQVLRFELVGKVENGVRVFDDSDTPEKIITYDFTLQITDNSSVEHPNPIKTSADFIAMCESISQSYVESEIANNPNIDPSELNFGNYILLADLTLENWMPRALNVTNFDGNGFTITIESWNFADIVSGDELEAGLFTTIGEYTVVRNLNVDISELLSKTETEEDAKTVFKANNAYIKDVTFGVVAARNEGVLSNVKVVSTNANNTYLNLYSKQGYYDGDICSATISGFVAENSGAISNCFVGLNAVTDSEKTQSTILHTVSNDDKNKSKSETVYPFTIVGGNRISGFVSTNSGTISNSYVMGVSIKNTTIIDANSMTAGFVGTNASEGRISSAFVSGSEYNNDIENLRATKTNITSLGSIGGFVHTNAGTIEDAYSMVQLIIKSVESAGFVYKNEVGATIRNAYTTTITSGTPSLAHGMFVNVDSNPDGYGTLENCYYLIIEGEHGVTSTNKNQAFLKSFDPTNAIISEASATDGQTIAFANNESFEGFTFASNISSLDGIWLMDGNYPRLLNTVNYNIESVRSLIGDRTQEVTKREYVTSEDGTTVTITTYYNDNTNDTTEVNYEVNKGYPTPGKSRTDKVLKSTTYRTYKEGDDTKVEITYIYADDTQKTEVVKYEDNKGYPTLEDEETEKTEIKEETVDKTNVVYNYTYEENPNRGSKENPLMISNPTQLLEYIITNTNVIGDKENKLYVFGGREETNNTVFAPRYVQLINDISLSKISLNKTYTTANNATVQITLSEVVFAGYFIGNGMTIDGIKYEATAESGNSIEDFGLFKQIGMNATQQKAFKDEVVGATLASPLVYNVNLKYDEWSNTKSKKVGLLAGSIYDNSTIMHVTVEGEREEETNQLNIIKGYNLVGSLAGLIMGEGIKLNDITIKNVRVNASNNPLASLASNYESIDAYYEKFSDTNNQDNQSYTRINVAWSGDNKKITGITNIDNISYAGSVAGAIIVNNTEKEQKKEDENKTAGVVTAQAEPSQPTTVTDMTAYNYTDYRNNQASIHDIVVCGNIEVAGDMAGGLFGYVGNSHIRNSYFMLMRGQNSSSDYQRISSKAFGGAIAGETQNSIFERVNVQHENTKLDGEDDYYQDNIDKNVGSYSNPSDVSKTDLFADASSVLVSVAIGGFTGIGKNLIVLDSYSKVNVYNPNAKIAGGMIGYAEEKNLIAFSYTYGNVRAKEVIGGLIGFYRYSSFDLYLNNATALNVWGSDVKSILTTNLSAIYGADTTGITLRAPEIGNQMSEYLDNDDHYKLTNITNGIQNQTSRFVYFGTILGKATLNEGTYTWGDEIEKITLTVEDNKVTATKEVVTDGTTKSYTSEVLTTNLFVHSDDYDLINYSGNRLYSIPVFVSTNGTITDSASNLMKVLYNSAYSSTKNESKEYYTYIGDQFYNVYSSLYGVTTRTGSKEDDDMISTFDGLTPNNADATKTVFVENNKYYSEYINADNSTDPPTEEKKVLNKNAIKYSTIFGTQYAVSQITGYYYTSDSAECGLEEYLNVFSGPVGYGYDFTQDIIFDVAIPSISTNNDLISALNSVITEKDETINAYNSSAWYFNDNTGILEYRNGQEGEVNKITTHEEARAVFNSNTKGKLYTVEINDSGSQINVGNDGEYAFSQSFRGTLTGDTDNDESTRTINIMYGDSAMPLFESMEGATIKNLIFVIDLRELGESISAKTNEFGIFARYIYNTTFDKCQFVFKNMKLSSINTYVGDGGEAKYFGFLFGRIQNSTLTNCTIKFEYKDGCEKVENLTIKSVSNYLGFVAGDISGTVSNLTIDNAPSNLTVQVGDYKGNASGAFSTDNSGVMANIGSLFGAVNGSVSNVTSPIELSVKGTVANGASSIGGLVGTLSGGSLNNTNYNHSLKVDVKGGNLSSARDKSRAKAGSIAIGGVVGKYAGGDLTNCQFCGEMMANKDKDGNIIKDENGNITYNYTDNSTDKKFVVKLKNSAISSNSAMSFYVGGVVGWANEVQLNPGVSLINRVNIDVEVYADTNNSVDNVYVGGILGAQTGITATGAQHTNFINTANVTVKINPNSESASKSRLHDNVCVGGLIGVSDCGLNSSYMQGDVVVDGGLNVYEGGLIGAFTESRTFTKCIAYGDVHYTFDRITYLGNLLQEPRYYLGGLIGGYMGTSQTTVEATFENCTVLAGVHEVILNEDKYVIEEEWQIKDNEDKDINNPTNPYDVNKYKYLFISPFVNIITNNNNKYTNRYKGIILGEGTANKGNFYLIEDYFDFYYNKKDNAGKYYYDVYGELKEQFVTNYSENQVKMKEEEEEEEEGVYVYQTSSNDNQYFIGGVYYFAKEYELGSKYNYATYSYTGCDSSGNPTGGAKKDVRSNEYYVLTESKTIKIRSVQYITVWRYGVLVGNTTDGIKLTWDTTLPSHHINNRGVMENIIIEDNNKTSAHKAIDENAGVLNNVVVKGKKDDLYNVVIGKKDDFNSANIGGLVRTNNGYVYRSGAVIVYECQTTSVITIGGLVHTNNHIIDTSYCDSMIVGLRYDEDGKAYYIDDGETRYYNIRSGGIAFNNTNTGTINNCAFAGVLYSGGSHEGKPVSMDTGYANLVYENKGTIEGCYSDKYSMWYAVTKVDKDENGKPISVYYKTSKGVVVLVDAPSGDFAKAEGYGKFLARYYVKDGINNIETNINETNNVVSYFSAKHNENVVPIFGNRDLKNYNKNTVSLGGKYILVNDIFVGYEANMWCSYDGQELIRYYTGEVVYTEKKVDDKLLYLGGEDETIMISSYVETLHTANIDIYSIPKYTGSIEGNGHSIVSKSGMNHTMSLFAGNPNINNLTITNFDTTANGILGINLGTTTQNVKRRIISNINFDGCNVNFTFDDKNKETYKSNSNYNVGLIAGSLYCYELKNISVDGENPCNVSANYNITIKSNTKFNVGYLVGDMYGCISEDSIYTSKKSTLKVSGIQQTPLASVGIIGYATSSKIKNITNNTQFDYSKFEGVNRVRVGGIVGAAINTDIVSCNNYADLNDISNTMSRVGGIAGLYSYNSCDVVEHGIFNSTNYGQIKSGYAAGAIVGQMHSGRIENCTNSSYKDMGSKFVGGCVGYVSYNSYQFTNYKYIEEKLYTKTENVDAADNKIVIKNFKDGYSKSITGEVCAGGIIGYVERAVDNNKNTLERNIELSNNTINYLTISATKNDDARAGGVIGSVGYDNDTSSTGDAKVHINMDNNIIGDDTDWICSSLRTRTITGYNESSVSISYDVCNPFAIIDKDFGEDYFAKYNSFDLNSDMKRYFDEFAKWFNSDMKAVGNYLYSDDYFGSLYNQSQIRTAVKNIFNESKEGNENIIFDNVGNGVVIGLNHTYARGNDISKLKDINPQKLVANLFGYENTDEFMKIAQDLADEYAFSFDSSYVKDPLLNGCVYNETYNLFMFPMVFKTQADLAVYSCVVIEIVEGHEEIPTLNRVSIYIDNYEKACQLINCNDDYYTADSVSYKLYCKNALFDSTTNNGSDKSITVESALFAGGIVGYSSVDCLTFKDTNGTAGNNSLAANIKLKFKAGNTIYDDPDEWYKKIENNGWTVGNKSYRFSENIPHNDLVQFFGFGNKPNGFSVWIEDESWTNYWYGPAGYWLHDQIRDGCTGESDYDTISALWKSGTSDYNGRFQTDKDGPDDSKYYSNLQVFDTNTQDNYFASANMKSYKIKTYSGVVYGYLGDGADEYNAKTIELSDLSFIDYTNIVGQNGVAKKYLLDRYTQWVYAAVETQENNYKNSGVFVIEYDLYITNNEYSGMSYSDNTGSWLIQENNKFEEKPEMLTYLLKHHVDTYIALNAYLKKNAGHFDACTCGGRSGKMTWSLETFRKVRSEYSGKELLYTDGFIKDFCKMLKTNTLGSINLTIGSDLSRFNIIKYTYGALNAADGYNKYVNYNR